LVKQRRYLSRRGGREGGKEGGRDGWMDEWMSENGHPHVFPVPVAVVVGIAEEVPVKEGREGGREDQ